MKSFASSRALWSGRLKQSRSTKQKHHRILLPQHQTENWPFDVMWYGCSHLHINLNTNALCNRFHRLKASKFSSKNRRFPHFNYFIVCWINQTRLYFVHWRLHPLCVTTFWLTNKSDSQFDLLLLARHHSTQSTMSWKRPQYSHGGACAQLDHSEFSRKFIIFFGALYANCADICAQLIVWSLMKSELFHHFWRAYTLSNRKYT